MLFSISKLKMFIKKRRYKMKDISRSITMLCKACGNDNFEAVDPKYKDVNNVPEYAELKCSDCGRIITKKELIDENEDRINANIEDMENEFTSEVVKEIEKALK